MAEARVCQRCNTAVLDARKPDGQMIVLDVDQELRWMTGLESTKADVVLARPTFALREHECGGKQ